jgi:hypothetical protein
LKYLSNGPKHLFFKKTNDQEHFKILTKIQRRPSLKNHEYKNSGMAGKVALCDFRTKENITKTLLLVVFYFLSFADKNTFPTTYFYNKKE